MATITKQQLTGAAEALFVSSLQPSDHPVPAQVWAAVDTSLEDYRDATGCAAKMAVEFGEHPEQAAARMRWALELITANAW